MQRLGVIARADDGGLGNLLWEFCRHLEPDRVLIMDLGEHGRSAVHLDRFDGLDVRVRQGWGPTQDDVRWLLDGCDVLYSAETWYDDDVPHMAKAAGVRTVLHVMPELYLTQRIADEIWVPTTYRRGFLPANRLVPVPVALDRFTYKQRSPATHFVHTWAPAMLDRNGTNPTLAALECVKVPIRATILGAQHAIQLEGRAPVELKSDPGAPRPDNYFEIWPDDADVLIMPRRFAGLSMPVQEAAAQGIPAIMTAVDPQVDWPGVVGCLTRGRPGRSRMAGGMIDVYDPDPGSIADKITQLATDDAYAARMSDQARAWAEGLSWDVWTPRYRQALGLV